MIYIRLIIYAGAIDIFYPAGKPRKGKLNMARRLTKLSYADAYNYFQSGTDKEKYNYIISVPKGPVCDFRGLDFPTEILDKMIAEKAFIFMDGVSGTGKSTLARKIQQRYGEDKVAVLDIDYICKDYLESMQKKLSKNEFLKFFFHFQEKSDKYITENLENMVIKASEGKKSVVIVGSYIFVIARAVMGYTLGMKYFPNTVSITLVEEINVISNRLLKRDKKFDCHQIVSEINFLNQMINEDISFLGIGTNLTIVANSQTNWW